MSILVQGPGLQTTLQALGRTGHQHLGVGPGGAMDEVSHRLASLLVGNAPDLPSMEITLTGPALEFATDSLIALAGADLSAEAAGLPVPHWRPVLVRAGTTLQFGKALEGCRCYLAVAGGFGVPAALGSASTNLAGGFGGFHGRALHAGDRLETGPPPADRCPGLQRLFQGETRAVLSTGWFLPWFQELDFRRPAQLRLIPGPHWPLLRAESRAALLNETYRLASDSDRMGLRLRGPKLALERPLEPVSAGVATGTLQLPADGAPILLMADRQTTGGYPRLGELASVDLPKAAQLRPGDPLRFRLITLEEAQDQGLERAARLEELAVVVADRLLR
jgi:antagonist of KipI